MESSFIILVLAVCFIVYRISKTSLRVSISLNDSQPAQRPVSYQAARVGQPPRQMLPMSGPRTNLGHGPVSTHSWHESKPAKPLSTELQICSSVLALPAGKLSDRIKAAHPDHGGTRERLEKILEDKRIKNV